MPVAAGRPAESTIMSNAFSEIAFTRGVAAVQERNGSRAAMRRFTALAPEDRALGAREMAFIAARASFYQATVSETGWPYVQHRGGPAGFLRVLDAGTLGYADFRGNVQYVSAGNLGSNDRVALILVDYATRERLKIWGRARIVEIAATASETSAAVSAGDTEFMARVALPAYRARVERGILIRVEAFAWNCPQHIPLAHDAAELQRIVTPLQEENRRLRAQLDALRSLPHG